MSVSPSGHRTVSNVTGRVLAALVGAGLAFAFLSGCGSMGSPPEAANFSTTVQGAVIVAGKSAPTTIDVYEDFLCPICERFEARNNADLVKAINEGKAQVRYHAVAILDRASTPPGYSTRAANAAICAADAGVFPAYHEKLFADQPSEGSAGLTDQELIAKGEEVGAKGNFAQCVSSGMHTRAVKAETDRAAKDTSVRRPGKDGFGTPTVTVNGKWMDWQDGDWLASVK